LTRATRRTPGIRPTRSGNWEARYYDDRGHLRGKTFPRKADAEAFRSTVRADVRRGTWVDPAASVTPFGTWATTWLASRLNVRRTTLATDEGCVRKHLLPRFGTVPIGRIARSDVQRWIKSLNDAGVGPDTVRRCHRLLKTIMAAAVEERLIPESPCRRISLPRINRREQLFLTAHEVELLADAIDPLYRALVYTAAYLGCRWGELAGLKRENLDVARRELRIVGTLEELGRDVRYVEETKTSSSRRNLSVPEFLAEMLEEHLADAPPSDFVFVRPDGTWLRRATFRRAHWKPAVTAAGLDPALRFHDLRHSCAGLLIAQGVHPKEIQARLGHASITTTLNTYGHLWPSLGAQLDAKIENVYREARGARAAQ
jgi:integrase